MMYLKLSIRNARRSFINYLLYVVAMTVLLAVIEVSNCITIIGELDTSITAKRTVMVTTYKR